MSGDVFLCVCVPKMSAVFSVPIAEPARNRVAEAASAARYRQPHTDPNDDGQVGRTSEAQTDIDFVRLSRNDFFDPFLVWARGIRISI